MDGHGQKYGDKQQIKQKKTNKKVKNSQKGSKSQRKNDEWSMKALEDFLETLREQPAKEMNDRCNKWIMFVERMKNKVTEKSNDYSGKQVLTIYCL